MQLQKWVRISKLNVLHVSQFKFVGNLKNVAIVAAFFFACDILLRIIDLV